MSYPTSNVRQMKLGPLVSASEGKAMIVGWTGWVHCGK